MFILLNDAKAFQPLKKFLHFVEWLLSLHHIAISESRHVRDSKVPSAAPAQSAQVSYFISKVSPWKVLRKDQVSRRKSATINLVCQLQKPSRMLSTEFLWKYVRRSLIILVVTVSYLQCLRDGSWQEENRITDRWQLIIWGIFKVQEILR